MDSIDAAMKAMEILMPHITVHTYPDYDDIIEGMIEEKTIAKNE